MSCSGAVESYTMEAMMHDCKALQSVTSHSFGVGFALHREFFAHLVVSEMPAPFARLYKSLNFAIYLFA